jgi:hypothetical protein
LAEAARVEKERATTEFAAQPMQAQILALREMILALQQSVETLTEKCDDLCSDFDRSQRDETSAWD